jgi:hypothetical protein
MQNTCKYFFSNIKSNHRRSYKKVPIIYILLKFLANLYNYEYEYIFFTKGIWIFLFTIYTHHCTTRGHIFIYLVDFAVYSRHDMTNGNRKSMLCPFFTPFMTLPKKKKENNLIMSNQIGWSWTMQCNAALHMKIWDQSRRVLFIPGSPMLKFSSNHSNYY